MKHKSIRFAIGCSLIVLLAVATMRANPTISSGGYGETYTVQKTEYLSINMDELSLDDLLQLRISNPYTSGIAIVDNGLVVSGTFANYITNGDPRQGFLSKLSSDGIISWSNIFGSRDLITVDTFKPIHLSNGYIVNSLQTSDPNLKVFNDSFQETLSGGINGYIYGFSELNNEIVWSTYLGGFDQECCIRITKDSSDNIYLSLITWSFNFPTINSDNLHKGGPDSAFVKMDKNGNIIWSTVIGDKLSDYVIANHLGTNDTLNFGGWSDSENITTSSAFQTTNNGGFDGFVGQLNRSTGERIWSTFIGGSGLDRVNNVATDPLGNIYASGITTSPDFPLLNAIDSTFNGFSEGFVSKFSSNGSLLWSTFLGGEGFEEIFEIAIDTDGKLALTGLTDSSNFNTTDSTSFVGGSDQFFVKMDSAQNNIVYSTIFGGTENDGYLGFVFDDQNYYFSGATSPSGIIYKNQQQNSTYPFDFGETHSEYVMSIDKNSLSVNWYTETIAVPETNLDYDLDGLDNELEYNLCNNNIQPVCLDPMNPDTDGDGISDGYEIEYSLNPTKQDMSGDSDEDGLNNLQEYEVNTDPFSNDTDLDQMTDGWEVTMGLDPTMDDADGDLDSDGMTNIYEYNQDFNASNPKDGFLDYDEDGLTNAEEFTHGTDPRESDTDNDLMVDEWEVTHGLDPLSSEDAKKDRDGDLLSNRLEYRLKLDPNNPKELYIGISLLLLVVSGIIGYSRHRKKREKKARDEGWKSYEHKRKAMQSGFSSLKEYENAETSGFRHTKSRDLFINSGYTSVSQLNSTIEDSIIEAKSFLANETYKQIVQKIKSTQSPSELIEIQEKMSSYLEKLKEQQDTLQSLDDLLKQCLDISEDENHDYFVSLSPITLKQKETQISGIMEEISDVRTNLNVQLDKRKDWFQPWKSLLSLIQITEDNMPISLERISEVTQTEKHQTESLVIALLKEYPAIGAYDRENKEYKKGVNISEYLKVALKIFQDT